VPFQKNAARGKQQGIVKVKEATRTVNDAGKPKGASLPLSASRLPLPACRVSVLICTYNRPELLAQCLDALITRTSEKPDQIVVVNGGDDRADNVVRAQQAEAEKFGIEVRLVKTVNKNLAASRNVGLPFCTGDVVAMTDDDAEVEPGWITQMKRLHLEHKDAGVIGGAVVGADSDSFVSRLADQVTFPSSDRAGYVRTLPGVNVSYKREVIERSGSQDESLFRGEDVDYNWRVKQMGYEVYYDPSMRVLHHHRPTLRQFWRQHYMYGRAYYLVRRKWPEMYCVYPHGLKTGRDFLKLVNFVAAAIYEPFQFSLRLRKLNDRILGCPILMTNQLCWRFGMIRQMLIERGRVSNQQQSEPATPLVCKS
jgi:GT2 family glycosyltransferase